LLLSLWGLLLLYLPGLVWLFGRMLLGPVLLALVARVPLVPALVVVRR
jgi:hypothetical protein